MHNAINWFEIPVNDMSRAQTFYESLLGRPLKREECGGFPMAMLPADDKAVSGCLIQGEGFTPSEQGSVLYLNAEPSLDAALARASAAGGRVALDKTALPDDLGVFAHIIDSEGNRIGLHALQ